MQAQSTEGNQSFSDLNGNTKCINYSGNLSIEGLKANHSDFNSTSGNVHLERIQSPFSCTTYSGNITATNLKGDFETHTTTGVTEIVGAYGNSTISTYSGNVSMNGTDGSTLISTTEGNIFLDHHKGDAELTSYSGNIRGRFMKAEKIIEVNSTTGNIILQLEHPLSDLNIDFLTTSGYINIDKDGKKFQAQKELVLQQGKINVSAKTFSGNLFLK